MTTCIILPGTGFTNGHVDAISRTFGDALDPYRFQVQYLVYPADYGRSISYAESKAIGRRLLEDAIAAASDDVVVAGYSQGAAIAGDLAADWARSWPHDPLVGCALIADPSRPRGGGMPGTPIVSGYGIAGERPIQSMGGMPTLPVWWAANEGDPITALPQGNPLRSLADLTEYFSLSGPAAAQQWMQSLLDRALQQRWQRWWSIENWRTWTGAVAYARGYLIDGQHTSAYLDKGLAAGLARVVNQAVTG